MLFFVSSASNNDFVFFFVVMAVVGVYCQGSGCLRLVLLFWLMVVYAA
jgi:hypothetical protein